MKLLVIGGTQFVGRFVVEAALARGHEVTLFHRGRTRPELFPGVEKVLGDRDGGLDALAGRSWDAVVDTCGFVSRVVRASAELLAPSVGHYTFVSSLSVYRDLDVAGMDESAALAELPGDIEDETDLSTYGARKALCEREVEVFFPGRALHVRPGLVVGPYDYVERFAYWVGRVARGGEVLAPGRPDRPVQLIDARDLAEWMVRMAESRAVGIYNATGPDRPFLMRDVLEGCRAIAGSDARFVWVDDDFLVEHQVGEFAELPFWIPEATSAGLYTVDCRKALAAGLGFRPFADTARDTLFWLRGRSGPETPPFRRLAVLPPTGMVPEREAGILRAWHERAAGRSR